MFSYLFASECTSVRLNVFVFFPYVRVRMCMYICLFSFVCVAVFGLFVCVGVFRCTSCCVCNVLGICTFMYLCVCACVCVCVYVCVRAYTLVSALLESLYIVIFLAWSRTKCIRVLSTSTPAELVGKSQF